MIAAALIAAWKTRRPKVFCVMPPEVFPKTQVLAADQGLDNACRAAGLLSVLVIGDHLWGGAFRPGAAGPGTVPSGMGTLLST